MPRKCRENVSAGAFVTGATAWYAAFGSPGSSIERAMLLYGVRVVSWLFVLCALAAATGVFMPCLELRAVRTKHGSLSLYEASTHRALARKLIAAYQKSRGRALGELLMGKALEHV